MQDIIPSKCNMLQRETTHRIINSEEVRPKQSFASPSPPAKTLCLSCASSKVKSHHHFQPPEWVSNLEEQQTTEDPPPPSYKQSPPLPDICFYAGMLRHPRAVQFNYYCKNKDQKNPFTVRKYPPCISRPYVQKTARAFNDLASCFGLSAKEKKEYFITLNHESAFILNAKSSTSARCYGQMTLDRASDINKYIYDIQKRSRPTSSWGDYHDIYNHASARCPDLKKKLLPPDLLEQNFTGKKWTEKLTRHTKNSPFTCNIIEDPYSCLFYSMFNLRISQKDVEEKYNHPVDNLGSLEIPKDIQRHFQIFDERLKLNELLSVKGFTTVGGKRTEVSWLLLPEEVYSLFVKHKKPFKELRVQRVTLFPPEPLKHHFAHTAHNGGHTVGKSKFVGFMKQTRRALSNGTSCNRRKTCKRLRDSLLNNQLLSTRDLQALFVPYAKRNIRNSESRRFVATSEQDMENIRDPVHIRDYLKHKTFSNSSHPPDKEKVARISRDIQENCSFSL